MPRVYLDVCCLNRPFDDQTQDRIHLEAEAVILILARFQADEWEWVSSEAVDFEVEQIPDALRRANVQLLLNHAQRSVRVTQAETERMQQLVALGFRSMDALHIACAEAGTADVFLTTDDRLLRRAGRVAAQLQVKAENPLSWLRKVTKP
jgi:predicted nucleic acid-binding protein